MNRLGDEVGVAGAGIVDGGGDTAARDEGDRMIIPGRGNGGVSNTAAEALLERAGLLGKSEEDVGVLMDFVKSDTDMKLLLLMNSVLDLKAENKRLSGLLRENWKISPAIQKHVGDLCRVALLCGMYKSKLNVKSWHGKLLGPVLAYLRRAKDFPNEWWKDVEIAKTVKKMARAKINEAKKRLAEILNAPGGDKLGVDKVVSEWIPYPISHRLAYVAAFYIWMMRNTKKDAKTKKVQAKDGWEKIMKKLVELEKDYVNRVKDKDREEVAKEQTKFFDEFVSNYYKKLVNKETPLAKGFDWTAVGSLERDVKTLIDEVVHMRPKIAFLSF